LAFIFNTPQLINIVDPQSQSTNTTITQLQCSINGTEVSILNSTKSVTQINCTGNVVTNLPSGSNSDSFIKSSKNFSFVCLLLALILYLAICFNLFQAIRECISKTTTHLKKISSPYEILRDCSILIILPFILVGAIWFFVLLNNNFPDLMADAFLSITLTGVMIELIIIVAILSEIDRAVGEAVKIRKMRTLILTGFSLGVGILFILLAAVLVSFQNVDLRVLLMAGIFGIIVILFSFKWIYRLIKNRNLPPEVYEVD